MENEWHLTNCEVQTNHFGEPFHVIPNNGCTFHDRVSGGGHFLIGFIKGGGEFLSKLKGW